jgi:hypothetical protein
MPRRMPVVRIRRTTRIRVQTEQELILRTYASGFQCWCELCGCQARFVPWEEAAALASVPPPVLSCWVNQGSLHYGEAQTGTRLVCLSSLVKQVHHYANEKERKQ